MRVLFILLLVAMGIGAGIKEKDIPVSVEIKNEIPDPGSMINEGQNILQEGDLVVRLNQDPSSQFIKNFSRREKKYSHAGIVVFENGYPYIYHIVNGEENPDEKLRRDSLSHFADPRKNLAFGIFRYTITAGEIKKMKTLLHQWYQKGIRFDPLFDRDSDDKMYCSEMISKLLSRSTNKRIDVKTTGLTATEAGFLSAYLHRRYPEMSGLKLIAIDDCYDPAFCTAVKEYNYKYAGTAK